VTEAKDDTRGLELIAAYYGTEAPSRAEIAHLKRIEKLKAAVAKAIAQERLLRADVQALQRAIYDAEGARRRR